MSKPLTIDELKLQKRWVLWRLVKVEGKDRLTKVPFQINGRKASDTNPGTWSTYAECKAVESQFDGVGVVLCDGVWGVDLDECCDAATGKFTPESREIVIALDSYSEFSPSGTGCHVLGLGTIPGPGTKKPWPGAKAIEIYDKARYFTFTGRHLSKTPADLLARQAQVESLYLRVKGAKASLVVKARPDEDARYKKLWAGDKSDYKDDASAADLALCCILARRFNNNPFKIDNEFRNSGLYREKWEREDYRVRTILKAIGAGQVPVFYDAEELIEDDGVDEYLVEKLTKDHEGWFPLGDVSLVGGSSGTGKTYWMMTLFEKIRHGVEAWGHVTKARDYRVLMLDRGAKAMRRTLDKLGLSAEVRKRVIRVTGAQQIAGPVAVLTEATESEPGASAFFIEGLDLWLKEANKMNEVATALDELQRLATRRNVAIIASVGSAKEKTMNGRDTERYHGRDTLFGSVAWGRKSETIVLISKTDNDPLNDDCPRQYSILVRNGRSEHFWMAFENGELRMVDRPEPKEPDNRRDRGNVVKLNIKTHFKVGERIDYSPDLGASDKTFYKYAKELVAEGFAEKRMDGRFYLIRGYYARDSVVLPLPQKKKKD
jgi:hypothetical protein